MILLSEGLKYHEMKARIRSSKDGNISLTESPIATCENIAPDITKKNPA
jgi:hypothetical protein